VVVVRAARKVDLVPGGVTPCRILKIGNRDQSNALSANAYSSRTNEASAFAQAASDRSTLKNMALVLAEDVERNLVGKLLVSAIAQMIAGNPVDVKELGMGKLRR
jgi:hypothetical protein